MYPNLEAELKRKNVKRADIAELLECTVGTVSEKMTGNSGFTLSAAIKIKNFLGVDIPLEILFAKTDNVETAQPAA